MKLPHRGCAIARRLKSPATAFAFRRRRMRRTVEPVAALANPVRSAQLANASAVPIKSNAELAASI
jgi:hypothetical protein